MFTPVYEHQNRIMQGKFSEKRSYGRYIFYVHACENDQECFTCTPDNFAISGEIHENSAQKAVSIMRKLITSQLL